MTPKERADRSIGQLRTLENQWHYILPSRLLGCDISFYEGYAIATFSLLESYYEEVQIT